MIPKTWNDPDYKWLTAEEFCKLLKINRATLHRWFKKEKLQQNGYEVTRIGAKWYICIPTHILSNTPIE